MRYTIRPLGPWTEPQTDPRRSSSVFRATWEETLQLLGYELEHLDAHNVVIQVDADETDIRMDGMLRARAHVGFPGVRIAFDSKHGPLTYSTDAYEQRWSGSLAGWQANVRAIALGLEALRAVDRYGVTRRGEQYTGWRAIGAGPTATPAAAMTIETAAQFMAHAADPHGRLPNLEQTLRRGHLVEATFRSAAKRLHPDAGGDTAEFQKLQQARRLLANETGR